MLLQQIHHPGNIRMYRKPNKAALSHVARDFTDLTVDQYVKEGFRRKHMVRYTVISRNPLNIELCPQEPLFQRKQFNPVHGDISRVYPIFRPSVDSMRVIASFIEVSKVKAGNRILVQAQRITCTEDQEGLPSVEDWHQDDVTEIGIFCAGRHNIIGGINQFKGVNDSDAFLSCVLQPGELVVFEDAPVKHRVSPIQVKDIKAGIGYRDVILFSHGGST
jgi:hypothetical protein